MLCAREIDKGEPGGLARSERGEGPSRSSIKRKKKLDTVPFAEPAILERPHADFPYPRIICCFRVVGGFGGTGSIITTIVTTTTTLLRRAMGLQKASDRVHRRLESEVAKEESRSGRLFLRGKGFSREFRLALPLTLGVVIIERYSGFQRPALKAVTFGGLG
jgi:hypothetical protein